MCYLATTFHLTAAEGGNRLTNTIEEMPREKPEAVFRGHHSRPHHEFRGYGA